MSHVSPESRKFKATDAKQLLENPMLQEAFTAVERHLSDAQDRAVGHRQHHC